MSPDETSLDPEGPTDEELESALAEFETESDEIETARRYS